MAHIDSHPSTATVVVRRQSLHNTIQSRMRRQEVSGKYQAGKNRRPPLGVRIRCIITFDYIGNKISTSVQHLSAPASAHLSHPETKLADDRTPRCRRTLT